jgi:PAS domain S-box-containing protein
VELTWAATGSDIVWKQDEGYQPHEDKYLMLDCAKARYRLQREPRLDLITALRWTVEWMHSLQAGADMRRVSESQIGRFMELVPHGATRSSLTSRQRKVQDPAQPISPLPAPARLLDLIDQTVIARTPNGLISFWNRGAEQMYGWTKDEALGQVSHVLLQTQFPQSLEAIETELVRHGRWEGKLVHARRDGTRIEVHSRWMLHEEEPSCGETVLEMNHPMCSGLQS